MFWFLLLETAIMGIFLSLDLFAFFVFWEACSSRCTSSSQDGEARPQTRPRSSSSAPRPVRPSSSRRCWSSAFLHQADTDLTFDYGCSPPGTAWPGVDRAWLFVGFMARSGSRRRSSRSTRGSPTCIPRRRRRFGRAGRRHPEDGRVRLPPLLGESSSQASVDFAPLLLTLAVIGIMYGSIVAAMERTTKRVIAYSSVSHMGFVVLGIFSITIFGLDGASFTMVGPPLRPVRSSSSSGCCTSGDTRATIDDYRGIWKSTPKLASLFLVAMFAGIGLPAFSGFVGEFLSLFGSFTVHRWWAVVATSGSSSPRCTCCGSTSACHRRALGETARCARDRPRAGRRRAPARPDPLHRAVLEAGVDRVEPR